MGFGEDSTFLVETIDFLIVGTVRNVEKTIEKDVERFIKIFSSLGVFRIFLVESDSDDMTLKILGKLALENDHFDFETLGRLADKIPNRIDRLQFCRNRYLLKFKTDQKLASTSFVVVADFDGINNDLEASALRNALERNQEWNALFANSSRRYYDILALRHPVWCPNNAFEDTESLASHVGYATAKQICVYNKMVNIPQSADLIPVISAFGGLAIYRASCLKDFDYSPTSKDRAGDIDHVILNRKIHSSSGKLYIDPNLINTKWNQHNLMSIKFLRELNYLSNKLNLKRLRNFLKFIQEIIIK